MAATYAEGITSLQNTVRKFDELDLYLNTNSENFLDHENTLRLSLKGDYDQEIRGTGRGQENTLASILTPASVQQGLAPHIAEILTAIDEPVSGDFATDMVTWREVLNGASGNARSFNDREITFGSVSAGGSNVGNGTVHRLTVDENDEDLQGVTLETKTAKIISDVNQTGALDEDILLILGETAERTFAKVDGSGVDARVKGRTAVDSRAFVSNPSFDEFSGTQPTAGSPTTPASTTSVTGWVLSSTAAFEVDADTTYRSFEGAGTPLSLKFVDNGSATQIFRNNVNPRFKIRTPLYWQIAVFRESNCDGTFTFALGAASKATTVSTLTNAAWNVVVTNKDSDCYYRTYKDTSDLTLGLTLASRTTGAIYVDDLLLTEWDLIDGSYYVYVAGSTPSAEQDEFTWTDSSVAARGIMVYWLIYRTGLSAILNWAYSVNVTTGGTETLADPS